jgi:hypothetical protein
MQKKDETLRSYIQRWSVIKNSAEDVSDERAIDVFSAGLHRSDLMGRGRENKAKDSVRINGSSQQFC